MAYYSFTKEEMEKNPPRKISTGLYGKKAYDIISSVFGQLSDGIWENSPRMNWAWQFAEMEYHEGGIKDDEEVNILVASVYGIPEYRQKWSAWQRKIVNAYAGQFENKYKRMTDQEIRKFFATKIYQIFREEANDCKNMKWNRNNMYELQYMDGNVATAWEVVNHLKNFEKFVPAV